MGIRTKGTRIRKRLVMALLVLLPVYANGFELEVLPEKPIIGKYITLKIWTDIPTTEKIEVEDIELPEEFKKVSGPIIKNYRKLVDRRYKRFYQVTWALRCQTPGIYSVGSVSLKVNDEVHNLEFPRVIVYRADEVRNNFPLLVNWSSDIKREIYVGESLPLIIEASNLEGIQFPDRVISSPPRRGDFIEVSGLGEIYQEDSETETLYRVSVASWMYTPLQPGKVTIPSVRVDINGLKRYTDKLVIDVKPIPEINTTRGVGDFIIRASVNETQVTPEDTFEYRVRVEGQGNLPYFNFPEFKHPGLILIDKREDNSIEYSDKGAVGWREITYTLQALESGVKEISLSGVSWINWSGEEIFFNGVRSHINVVSVKVEEEEILPFLSFMSTPEIISSYRVYLYKQPLMWLTLLVTLFIMAVIGVVRIFKGNSGKKTLLISMVLLPVSLYSVVLAKGFEFQGDLVSAENYIEEGRYEEAVTIYSQLAEDLPNNYGLYINMAILWDKMDNLSRAANSIRIAERIYPGSDKVRRIKEYLFKSEEENRKQAKTVSSVNPDYIFISIAVLFNLLVIVVVKLLKNRNITNLSLFFIIIIFIVMLALGLIYVHNRNSVKAGIVAKNGAELIKVPNANALKWIRVKEGSCVYIRGEWENSYLIETEYGLKGWINKDSLIVLEER